MLDKLLDNKTMNWRVRKIDRNLKRLKWRLMHRFAHNVTETVHKFSMVVVGRNDNYGGDFSERLKTTIDWNYNRVPGCELIYVEWNALPDRPSDTEWISKRYPNSKCFIVPHSIHQDYCSNPKLPMMEYFAKNLGIREAGNEWIFCINADVFLSLDTIANMTKLNKDYVYGTHYKNIKWGQDEITDKYISDDAFIINEFSTNDKLQAVVGNFILMHRDKWLLSTGYDEALKDSRLGVDNNGLLNILAKGVKPMVIGDHYHLDHNESAIKGSNTTHGNQNVIKSKSNIPYTNEANWGLKDYQRKQVSERVWELQKI
ncbi:hypothetical protein BH09BAC1_BH09BAC1_17470 [soil metagenome]